MGGSSVKFLFTPHLAPRSSSFSAPSLSIIYRLACLTWSVCLSISSCSPLMIVIPASNDDDEQSLDCFSLRQIRFALLFVFVSAVFHFILEFTLFASFCLSALSPTFLFFYIYFAPLLGLTCRFIFSVSHANRLLSISNLFYFAWAASFLLPTLIFVLSDLIFKVAACLAEEADLEQVKETIFALQIIHTNVTFFCLFRFLLVRNCMHAK
jgi:hypothetical protein